MLPDKEYELCDQPFAKAFGVNGHILVFENVECVKCVAVSEKGRMQPPDFLEL